MKGDPLPSSNHIARYCGYESFHGGRVDGVAFRLKVKNGKREEYVSVNWLEYLTDAPRDEQIQGVRDALFDKGLSLGAKSVLAVLNVGQLIENVREKSPDRTLLRVLHEPQETDPSHSGIYDIPSDQELVADLIAEVVQETYPGRVQSN